MARLSEQQLNQAPIYCYRCAKSNTWQRNPAIDHKGINIGFECPCGNRTWRREIKNKEGN